MIEISPLSEMTGTCLSAMIVLRSFVILKFRVEYARESLSMSHLYTLL
jgi:hypothetical protein